MIFGLVFFWGGGGILVGKLAGEGSAGEAVGFSGR